MTCLQPKLITVLMTVGIVPWSLAQTFNKRYDALEQAQQDGAWSVERSDSGGFVVFASSPWQDSLYYSSVITSLNLSGSGEAVDIEKIAYFYYPTYPGWANSSGRLLNGGIVVGGSTYRSGPIQRPALFFFNGLGIPQGMVELGPDSGEWIGRQAKQAPDKGYVVCGETSSTGIVDAFLIKTDSLGLAEWSHTYGGPYADYSVAVDTVHGGGFYLGGERRNVPSQSQLWVQRLDSVGNIIWQHAWGSIYDEPNAHITTASDGNCLVASFWGYGDEFSSTRPYLAKLQQSDGAILWDRKYGDVEYSTGLYAVKEVQPFGDLIAVGELWSNFEKGLLLRTTADGDSVWMREYYYYDDALLQGKGLFRDVLPTQDGGFIAVGTTYGNAAGPTPPGYNQDVWVVKVDSLGCIVPGCDIITGIHAQITNLKDALAVYPNPVRSVLHVKIKLPSHFNTEGPLMLTMTSLDGRLVRQQQVPTSATDEVTVEVSALASGTYALHLSDAQRWIAGKTFVVE